MQYQTPKIKNHQPHHFGLKLPEQTYRTVGTASLAILGIIGALAFCPISNPETNAATSGSVKVSVKAASNLSFSLDPTVTMEMNAGEFQPGVAAMKISTNNPTGYAVYMQTLDNQSTLSNETDTTITQTINSITANTLGSAMTGNTWGYSFGTDPINASSTFKQVQSTNTRIHSTTTASATGQTDNYNLGFGAHIDNTLPSGVYSNSVVISVIANPF